MPRPPLQQAGTNGIADWSTDLVDLPAGDEDEVAGARREQQRALGVAVEVPIPFNNKPQAVGPALPGLPPVVIEAGRRCKAE